VSRSKRALAALDRWQQGHRLAAVAVAVQRKFSDDNGSRFVVALGWYGFISTFPLLLLVVTVLAFIGQASLGHDVVRTVHQFPVVGPEFNPAHASASLHGSMLGLVAGLLALLYGASGVTQAAELIMLDVWALPRSARPRLADRLARSLVALLLIGGAFLLNAAVAGYATAAGPVVEAPVVVGLVLVNVAFYLAVFRALTPKLIDTRALLPGAGFGALAYTLLITLGAGLIAHQLRHSSATYGQFGVVIGLVGFLFLLAKLSLYGAELNPVLAGHLWPRHLRAEDDEPATEVPRAGQSPVPAAPETPLPASNVERT
jgi:uncharacterized BrkB/YihY/UPF0761 family membrane protein